MEFEEGRLISPRRLWGWGVKAHPPFLKSDKTTATRFITYLEKVLDLCLVIAVNYTTMKNLTHKQLVDVFTKAQGDMTLVPGDPRRVTDQDTVRRAFTELCRRQGETMSRGLHGVKR